MTTNKLDQSVSKMDSLCKRMDSLEIKADAQFHREAVEGSPKPAAEPTPRPQGNFRVTTGPTPHRNPTMFHGRR